MSAEPSSDPAYAYAPPPTGRRGLGAWSLVCGLLAPALGLVLAALLVVLDASGDPWSALAVFLLGLMLVATVAFIAGILALVLGILAVRRGRGRGLGIAGIVLGSLSVLGSLPALPAVVVWVGSAFGAA
jgi:hypothetical protein